jgi:hypothetical protein
LALLNEVACGRSEGVGGRELDGLLLRLVDGRRVPACSDLIPQQRCQSARRSQGEVSSDDWIGVAPLVAEQIDGA